LDFGIRDHGPAKAGHYDRTYAFQIRVPKIQIPRQASQRRCCSVVAFVPRRSCESTVIRAWGAYISSQLCSDQNTSLSGAGLYLFFAELSNSVTTVTLLPAGMCRGVASS